VFDWLFEGRIVVYCLLGVLAVVFLFLWWQNRKRWLLVSAGAMIALGGLYFILDKLVETPSEQIERKLAQMAAAVKTRDAEAIFRHIAADFQFRGQDRARFRAYTETVFQHGWIGELAVWEFQWPEGGTDSTRPVQFLAKPLGGVFSNDLYYLIRADFVRESDGQWRLKGFEIFNPYSDSKTPLSIPGLP
jgi:hypothetical protein